MAWKRGTRVFVAALIGLLTLAGGAPMPHRGEEGTLAACSVATPLVFEAASPQATPRAEEKSPDEVLALKRNAWALFLVVVIISLLAFYLAAVGLLISRKRWRREKIKPTRLEDLWWTSGKNIPPVPPKPPEKEKPKN